MLNGKDEVIMKIREFLVLVLMSSIGGLCIALGIEDRPSERSELWTYIASCVGVIILIGYTYTVKPTKKPRGATRV